MPDTINAPTPYYRAELEAAIVQRALADGAFWDALVHDATSALSQYFSAQGKTMPPGLRVTAVVEDSKTFYHIIPDPAYFVPSLGVGGASLNPRESFHARTDYLLTHKDGDANTQGLSVAQLADALAVAQNEWASARNALAQAQVLASQDASAMNLAWAELQDAQFAALDAATAATENPDDMTLAALSAQAADRQGQAQVAYSGAAQTAQQSQDAVSVADACYATATANLDAAQRAWFQANFELDPVVAAAQSFNTSMPFVTVAEEAAAMQADADLQAAVALAQSTAASSDVASQNAVAASRELAQDPGNSDLQALAESTAQAATNQAASAAAAADSAAAARHSAGAAAEAARGVRLVVLDEAADGTFYLVLPHAPHQSAFMGPYSLQLTGNAYAAYPVATDALMPVGKMAVEVWMQSPEFDPARQDVMVSLGNSAAGWQLDCRGGVVSLTMSLQLNGVTTTHAVRQPGSLPTLEAGRWHYIAGVYDGQAIQLYVDGRWVVQTEAAGELVPYDGGLVLGRNADLLDDASYFNGLLHEVRLWGDALTPSQIADNRNQAQPVADLPEGAQALLLAHYEFNEGAGTVALDSSGHHHDLRLQAGATWQNTGLRSPT